MDICTALDRDINSRRRTSLPAAWVAQPEFDGLDTLDDLIGVIRRLDGHSDQVLLALLDGDARRDPLCSSAIVAALLPLVLTRCRGARDRVDDYVAELALVVGTVPIEALRRSRRRVASVLLDRAWDEVRRPVRRPAPVVPVDPVGLSMRQAATADSVEDEAIARITAARLSADVCRVAVDRPWVWPAWESALALVDVAERDSVQARRWKYVRGVLRRHVWPDVAA